MHWQVCRNASVDLQQISVPKVNTIQVIQIADPKTPLLRQAQHDSAQPWPPGAFPLSNRSIPLYRFIDFSIFPNPLACARVHKKRAGGRCAVSARNAEAGSGDPALQFPASAKPSLLEKSQCAGDSLVKVSAAVR